MVNGFLYFLIINAWSLAQPKVFQQLATEVSSCKPDIINVCETCFKSKHSAATFVLDAYKYFRNDRTRRRESGVGAYIKNSFDASFIMPKFISLVH